MSSLNLDVTMMVNKDELLGAILRQRAEHAKNYEQVAE